ncbi:MULTISPECIES: hypothetical protein [Kitasatospora]|uniref:NlpC/P60 domain-containing protein n=1 Tax=Kitasatospora setae (strain ATCC 33774 / DSM 43861 / JCM 3304 / KCC A-0304 / NBRC 14216 / KM-6054) TaxID=452652 RepID=E4NCH3_KITSK|nr:MULTISPECIES: hypothetical protein [Kitasatospora]BAJ28904.1 hypothetical protein KSE_30940 [Kitasatospora setae KM-6054]
MSAVRTSKALRTALAAAIALSGAIATTAVTVATATTAQAASSVDGQITRGEVIQRAQYWYGKTIAYNQGATYPDSSGRAYRTDCSGYVSMAWHLGASPSTQGLPGYATEIPRSQLKAGDILNSFYDHVILFEKWDDAAHTTFSYYSFGSTPVKHRTGISINAATFDSHPNGDYKAYRYNKIVDDTPSTTAAGTAHVEIIGSDGAMYNNDANYTTGTWSVWSQMDSASLTYLASASTGNTSHYYAVAADGGLYTRDADYAAGTWSDWAPVPGGASGAKGLTATATGNTVHLEIIGSDGAMYNNDANYTTGTWGSWTKMDSANLTHLASATTGNTSHYYAVATDGHVYTRDANYTTGTWSNWAEVPGGAGGAKGLTATATGNTVHLEIIGSDGAMYNNDANYTTGTWSTWTKLDSANLKSLASTTTGSTAHYYAVANDGAVYTRDADYTTGTWTDWVEVPGGAGGAKGITATATG